MLTSAYFFARIFSLKPVCVRMKWNRCQSSQTNCLLHWILMILRLCNSLWAVCPSAFLTSWLVLNRNGNSWKTKLHSGITFRSVPQFIKFNWIKIRSKTCARYPKHLRLWRRIWYISCRHHHYYYYLVQVVLRRVSKKALRSFVYYQNRALSIPLSLCSGIQVGVMWFILGFCKHKYDIRAYNELIINVICIFFQEKMQELASTLDKLETQWQEVDAATLTSAQDIDAHLKPLRVHLSWTFG